MDKQPVGETMIDRTLGLDGPGGTVVLGGDDATSTTLAAEPRASGVALRAGTTTLGSTVLPRVESLADGAGGVRLAREERPRYEQLRSLGEGGMGEVALMRDHDIAREVAFKRLRPEAQDPVTLARFVDEIRTIGQLEHPNIVPIHDVGVDAEQRYFFVMKYVQGETLEHVIDRLAARDPEYLRRYTFEARIQLFLGVLHALEFAHSRGVIHRDVKPANVMVGPFGEVVVMDWGIAKQVGARDRTQPAGAAADAPEPDVDATATRARLASTRHGALIGTPAYMSPEQARGHNDALDVRSDLYSAVVLFHELMGLRHYLAGKNTVTEVLSSVITGRWTYTQVLDAHHPDAPAVPAEIAHYIAKGLSHDPAQRFQSAGEMIEGLKDILAGRIKIQCHATFTKRTVREVGRVVDAHPHAGFLALVALVLVLVASAAMLVRAVV